jgi:hypothetical protein
MAGASADYMRYISSNPVKTDRIKDSTLLDFSLTPADTNFVKLTRGAYIKINSSTYPNWFTGYVINDPELEYIGTSSNGQTGHWEYKYQATSDEYLLSLKPLAVIPPFLNTTMGAVLKKLIQLMCPGVFDLTNIADGQFLSQYVVDPSNKFIDVANAFSEAANYKFWGNNGKLYFVKQDSLTGLTVDANNKAFSPAQLTLRPSQTPILNDVAVLGDIEPQTYMTEYFVGTGLDAAFNLQDSVFGADSTLFIDETFDQSQIDAQKWVTYDNANNWLQISNGYLNILGGSNNSSYDVSIQSAYPVPLEGNIRFTHGEFDFLDTNILGAHAGTGIIGSLWNGGYSQSLPNGSLTNCIYGLYWKGYDGNSASKFSLLPIVNGALDTSQSTPTLNTDGSVHYVIRTIANFTLLNRVEQEFNYLDETGIVQTAGGDLKDDTVTWTTTIIGISTSTGKQVEEYRFVNTVAMPGSTTAFATYIPVASNNISCTVSGITVSMPLNAALYSSTLVPFINGGFDSWLNHTKCNYWTGYSVFQETMFVSDGSACKFHADAIGNSYIFQAAASLIKPNTAYQVSFQAQKTNTITTGYLRIYLCKPDGTMLSAPIEIPVSGLTTAYKLYSGILTPGISSVPSDTLFKIAFENCDHNADAGWVDSVIVTSVPVAQLVGPNEVDALDGTAPVATIVAQAPQSNTNSTYLGTPQYYAGQAQLVFFKDSVAQTSTMPSTDQILKLVYRGAGPAIGRSIDRDSINLEASEWGDDGHRGVVRTDLTPRPRTSSECEAAAAAIVAENAFQHYEGDYTQDSTFLSAEPRAGCIFKIINGTALAANFQAEEINEVATTLLSMKPVEHFEHKITFGKPDHLRRFLSKFDRTENFFLQNNQVYTYNITAVDIDALGLNFAPDVTSPNLLAWDSQYLYLDIGMDLPSNGLFFEVRYTDSGWGVDDGKNLVTRTTNRYFTIPRNKYGRVFFIRMSIQGNFIKWSEDLTQGTVYSGVPVTKAIKTNQDGVLSTVSTIAFPSGSASLTGSVSAGLTGSHYSWSVSLKGPKGTSITAQFGSASKTVVLTGSWQRITVPVIGSAPTTVKLTHNGSAVNVDVAQLSVQNGLVESGYFKTTSTLYGPLSRWASGVNIAFPAPTALGAFDLSTLQGGPTY